MSWLNAYIYGLALACWIAAAIALYVVRVRRQAPSSRALLENTGERVILALVVSSVALVIWNGDNGYALFSLDAGRMLLRAAIVLLGVKPLVFIYLYATNGFRDGDGPAPKGRSS